MVEAHPFLPNLEDETIEKMLKQVKASSIADLFSDIPEGCAWSGSSRSQKWQGEAMVRRELHGRLARNKTPPESLCFLGGGVYPHYIPAAVDSILSRQEFYTAYTPYQPEISQGMLQALFEYQSMMCDLLGMQVCNSSMYDWASAAGEAVRMASRVKRRSDGPASRRASARGGWRSSGPTRSRWASSSSRSGSTPERGALDLRVV